MQALAELWNFAIAWYNLPFSLALLAFLGLSAVQFIGLEHDHGAAGADADAHLDLDHGVSVDHDFGVDHDVSVDHDLDMGHDADQPMVVQARAILVLLPFMADMSFEDLYLRYAAK